MDASPPESEHIMPRLMRMSRAYQFAQEPESEVMIALSGRRGDSSHTTRCGLTGLASAMARSSMVFHQSCMFDAIVSRHDVSAFDCRKGSKARSVSAESPTR